MSDWIKANWGIFAVVALAGSFVFFGQACSALDFESKEPVRIPQAFRDIGDPETLPLPEARISFKTMLASLDQFAGNISNAELRVEFKNQLANLVTEQLNIGAGIAIPGWGAFGGTALLAGLTGAMGFRKPGDVAQATAKEREDRAYDLGAQEALAKFREGLNTKV